MRGIRLSIHPQRKSGKSGKFGNQPLDAEKSWPERGKPYVRAKPAPMQVNGRMVYLGTACASPVASRRRGPTTSSWRVTVCTPRCSANKSAREAGDSMERRRAREHLRTGGATRGLKSKRRSG
jgi:hypothetical protein